MKNPNQIHEKPSALAERAQRKAPLRKRYRIPLTGEERTIIKAAAKKRGLTVSQLAERAIRSELSHSPKKGRGPKSLRPLVRQTRKKITASPAKTRSVRRLIEKNAVSDRITIRADGGTTLPGVIRRYDQEGAVKVITGRLEWTEADYSEALFSGRFLITVPTDFQRLALLNSNVGSDGMYEEFLAFIAKPHLAELRDTIPLYWIEESNPDRWLLISLRGELPPGCDPTFAEKARKALAEEMNTRNIDRRLCNLLDDLEWICRHGRPADLKALDQFLDRVTGEIEAARDGKGGAK